MSCNPCNCGDCDQSRSDNTFYTKQLHQRAAKVLGLDGDNTSWFEIIDVMEKELTAKPDFAALQAQYQRLLNGVDADLAEIDRIQAEYDTQFRKGRKFRMERDALITQIEHIKRLAMVVIQDRMTHVLVHPCDEYNDEAKARALPQDLQDLYEAVK